MSQRGFTLIEVMTASVAAALVMLAGSAMLLRGLSWFDQLNARIEMNRHAREVYGVLAYGGASTASGNDVTGYIYGINGRHAAPASGLRSNGAFQYTSNNLTLTPDKFASMTVSCTGAGTPVPDCTAGGSVALQGWLGRDVQINASSRSVANQTVEVTMSITDSFQAQRAKSPGDFTESYRGVFFLNRDETDP